MPEQSTRRRSWKPYGQVFELRIEDTGPGGEGLANQEGARYRVWGALPGERVRARVFGKKSGWRLANAEEIVDPSPARVTPRCPVFGACGGCVWQNLAYEAQLPLLERRVRALLCEAGVPLDQATWEPIIGSDAIWHYRNKIELSFSGAAGEARLGFNHRGRFWDIIDIDECFIGPPVNAQLIQRVRRWANESRLVPYQQRRHEGFLRYLVIRQEATALTRRWLAALVTTTPRSAPWGSEELVKSLSDLDPPGSLLWIRSDSRSGAVKVDSTDVLLGNGTLVERLGGVDYVLGVTSFFQANVALAERLVTIVRDLVLAGPHRHIVDLYCGVGTIALALADSCESVIGVELDLGAVSDAKANARAHGHGSASFVQEAAEKYEWARDVDLLILDPPRSGVHPRLIRHLMDSPVPRLIYISCNPQALARDLAEVSRHYTVKHVQCLDLFPHTRHIETIVELRRV